MLNGEPVHYDSMAPGVERQRYSSSSSASEAWHVLRRGLGLFWTIAGFLQFQPLMFTSDFYAWYPPSIMESTIQTAADDQPHFVASIVHFGSSVWATNPILFNILAASLQIIIGLLLLFGRGRLVKWSLRASIMWGLLVWGVGEAFGDVFGGSTYFDGFPGAALLYVITALLLLGFRAGDVKRSPTLLRSFLRYILTGYWFLMALFQVLPSSGFWQAGGLMEPFANEAAQPGPAFLAQPVQSFTFVVQSHTDVVNLAFVIIILGLAFLTLFDVWNAVTILLASLWLAWSWWFGQGFGAIFTGAGTDVNSIPLIGLWMLYLWLVRRDRV